MPLAALLRWQFVPLRETAGELRIARAEAPDAVLTAWLDAHLQETCRWLAASAAWISNTLAGEAADYRVLGEAALAASEAVADSELQQLAQRLLEALQSSPDGQTAVGKYQVDARGANIGVMGDQATVKDGIHFSTRPQTE